MATINPYIHFNGNAEEAFTFYRSVFGGEFKTIMRYKDIKCSCRIHREARTLPVLDWRKRK